MFAIALGSALAASLLTKIGEKAVERAADAVVDKTIGKTRPYSTLPQPRPSQSWSGAVSTHAGMNGHYLTPVDLPLWREIDRGESLPSALIK